jgi:hypothetical protein
MELAFVALIVIAWVLLDAMIVAGLVLMRLRGERRVRHAGQLLAAEAECYVHAVGAERALQPFRLPRSTAPANET